MPNPDRLQLLIDGYVHDWPERVRRLIMQLVLVGGEVGSAAEMAQAAGWHDRFQLAHALHDDGFPTLRRAGSD